MFKNTLYLVHFVKILIFTYKRYKFDLIKMFRREIIENPFFRSEKFTLINLG